MEPQAPTNLPSDEGLRTTLEGERRATPQDVEQARIKEREAYTKLLDDMEASVPTQGQWFAKIGERKPITEIQQEIRGGGFLGTKKIPVDKEVTTGYDDRRALILNAETKTSPYGPKQQDFTVVTPDGIFTATFYTSEVGADRTTNGRNENLRAQQYDRLRRVIAGDAEAANGLEYKTTINNNGSVLRALESDLTGRGYNGIELTAKDLSSEDFQQRVQESIALTESPHKANLEAASKGAEVASSASRIIQSLPPRG